MILGIKFLYFYHASRPEPEIKLNFLEYECQFSIHKADITSSVHSRNEEIIDIYIVNVFEQLVCCYSNYY